MVGNLAPDAIAESDAEELSAELDLDTETAGTVDSADNTSAATTSKKTKPVKSREQLDEEASVIAELRRDGVIPAGAADPVFVDETDLGAMRAAVGSDGEETAAETQQLAYLLACELLGNAVQHALKRKLYAGERVLTTCGSGGWN